MQESENPPDPNPQLPNDTFFVYASKSATQRRRAASSDGGIVTIRGCPNRTSDSSAPRRGRSAANAPFAPAGLAKSANTVLRVAGDAVARDPRATTTSAGVTDRRGWAAAARA